MTYVNDCHKDPEEIGVMVEKLIRAKNPPFRNIPDIESQVLSWLRRVLPFWVYSAMIRMFFMEGFSRPRSVPADHIPIRSERISSGRYRANGAFAGGRFREGRSVRSHR